MGIKRLPSDVFFTANSTFISLWGSNKLSPLWSLLLLFRILSSFFCLPIDESFNESSNCNLTFLKVPIATGTSRFWKCYERFLEIIPSSPVGRIFSDMRFWLPLRYFLSEATCIISSLQPTPGLTIIVSSTLFAETIRQVTLVKVQKREVTSPRRPGTNCNQKQTTTRNNE